MLYPEFDYGHIEIQDKISNKIYDKLKYVVRTYPEIIDNKKYLTIIYRDSRGRKYEESFNCDVVKFIVKHQGDMVFRT